MLRRPPRATLTATPFPYTTRFLSLFVSGQVGSRPDGSPEPDFERQIQLALDNLKATLRAAGCGLEDIVDVTTFHTDPERQFETIMAVKNRHFTALPHPSWTAVGVTWLSGFD